jgi:5'-deoxynucleotidase YfbR-like HD superfamily hydrolase
LTPSNQRRRTEARKTAPEKNSSADLKHDGAESRLQFLAPPPPHTNQEQNQNKEEICLRSETRL